MEGLIEIKLAGFDQDQPSTRASEKDKPGVDHDTRPRSSPHASSTASARSRPSAMQV